MSGEQPTARPPYRYAEDFDPTAQPDSLDLQEEEAIPMLKPVEKYLVDGVRKLFDAQGEFTAAITKLNAKVDAIAPQVQRLEADAALLKKVLTYGKYIAFGLVTRYFPEFAAGIAKHAPAIIEAAGKAAGQ